MKKTVMLSMVLAAGVSCAALAQVQPVSKAGTGMVTGHVTCGDTQRPARFAAVTLFAVPTEATAPPKLDANADPAAMLAALKSQIGNLAKTTMVSTQTDASGAFVAVDVAPGDYYVFAGAAGYVQPINQVQALMREGADAHKLLPGIAVVHVAAERTVNAEVSMQRGAAVSGTVLYDDGTPVTGAHVAVISTKADASQPPMEFAMLGTAGGFAGMMPGMSDDLGHFRISGLAAGEYDVQVTLTTKNPMNMTAGSMNLTKLMADKPLVVFAPAAFHKTDAKPVTLHAAEDMRDVTITFNLGGMHSVSGRIASAEDHHGLNAAVVAVVDAQDKDFVRSASVDAAGNFLVAFVPSGTYQLRVTSAGDTEPGKKDEKDKGDLFSFSEDHTLKSYDDKSQALIVADSDVAGLSVELPPSKTVRQAPSLSDLGLAGGTPKQ